MTIKETFDLLQKDHEKLDTLLENFTSYCNEFENEAKNFDVKKYKSFVKEVSDFLLPHLKIEEEIINPENLKKLMPDKEGQLKTLLDDIHNTSKEREENIQLSLLFLLPI
jgi:hemerythrin superfamily protein